MVYFSFSWKKWINVFNTQTVLLCTGLLMFLCENVVNPFRLLQRGKKNPKTFYMLSLIEGVGNIISSSVDIQK